ncbi:MULTISPECIES: sensor histidine kinase [unclassified Rhizobium]|uniref:sensor histidine kinase n=1 Tax=unclassified Rhizobium TaxID=2613769 RepID=UPI000ACAAD08|nr:MULTISPECIES: sensor histidine kinase [unclassified Rhizobium]
MRRPIEGHIQSRMRAMTGRWNALSLAHQFFIAGGAVALVAIVLVGAFVTNLIEATVTRNSAAATALYVDSIIAPILPDLKTAAALDETVERALDETLSQGALGQRLISFRLWRKDGTVLYANDKALMGRRFEPNADLQRAFSGGIVARFDHADDPESTTERATGKRLLEIYNPVLQPWSGEIVAVLEFYEVSNEFENDLRTARLSTWAAVILVTLLFFSVLSLIVFRGNRTIERQRVALAGRIAELSSLLSENKALSARVQRASQRTAALNENFLRRVGADLHDGPAQLVAFAGLRIDSEVLLDPSVSRARREQEITAIKDSLDEAMREIRSICTGLVLPDIEALGVRDIVERAVRAYRQRTGARVALVDETPVELPALSTAMRICIYRFVQETLNNGYRHAHAKGQSVTLNVTDRTVTVKTADEGAGFDVSAVQPKSLGLAGLRERIESLGGQFNIQATPQGTVVTMRLGLEEGEQT